LAFPDFAVGLATSRVRLDRGNGGFSQGGSLGDNGFTAERASVVRSRSADRRARVWKAAPGPAWIC
jgi:hypothetical protein